MRFVSEEVNLIIALDEILNNLLNCITDLDDLSDDYGLYLNKEINNLSYILNDLELILDELLDNFFDSKKGVRNYVSKNK